MRILSIGAHGKVALQASPLLAADGHEVTGVIRNPDHADEVRASGATPLLLDVEHSDTAALADALRGYDAVVWSAGAGGGNPDRTYAVDRDAAIRSMEVRYQRLMAAGKPAEAAIVPQARRPRRGPATNRRGKACRCPAQ